MHHLLTRLDNFYLVSPKQRVPVSSFRSRHCMPRTFVLSIHVAIQLHTHRGHVRNHRIVFVWLRSYIPFAIDHSPHACCCKLDCKSVPIAAPMARSIPSLQYKDTACTVPCTQSHRRREPTTIIRHPLQTLQTLKTLQTLQTLQTLHANHNPNRPLRPPPYWHRPLPPDKRTAVRRYMQPLCHAPLLLQYRCRVLTSISPSSPGQHLFMPFLAQSARPSRHTWPTYIGVPEQTHHLTTTATVHILVFLHSSSNACVQFNLTSTVQCAAAHISLQLVPAPLFAVIIMLETVWCTRTNSACLNFFDFCLTVLYLHVSTPDFSQIWKQNKTSLLTPANCLKTALP